MPTVWIPPNLRALTQQQTTVTVAGGTVRAALDALEQRHPGIKERLCEGENLRSGLALIVDSQAAPLGLSQAVAEQSEIHFIPALGGG